jgi:hypothetical protein
MEMNSFDTSSSSSSSSSSGSSFSKNSLIVILLLLLIFSFLGINIVTILGAFLQIITNIFGPLVIQILSIFGYTAGTVIDKSSDIIADTSISGIGLANGVLNDVGDLLKNASAGNVNPDAKNIMDNPGEIKLPIRPVEVKPLQAPVLWTNAPTNAATLQTSVNTSSVQTTVPSADTSASPIQNPIATTKSNWCLVGEYQDRRGCIEIGDSDKCLSGQVFPSQTMCLNPTITNNMKQFLQSVSEKDVYHPSPNLARPIY